jgi:ABC-type multidrug transport system fused ATPase/permease subunit
MILLFIVLPIIFGSAGVAASVCVAVSAVFVIIGTVTLSRRKAERDTLCCDAEKLAETINKGEATVKKFGRVRFERERIAAAAEAYTEAGYGFALYTAIFAAAYVLAAAFSVSAVIIAAGYGVIADEISEEYAVFVTVWIIAAAVVFGIIGYFMVFGENQTHKKSNSYERNITYGEISAEIDRNDLTFSGVVFSYNKREIFSGLSFFIESGERFAILGQTGTGKKTIEKLIKRELEPSGGEIKLGGIVISEYTKENLEKKLKRLDFIVSNRISDVMNYGKIILLESGVCEIGDHNSLMVSSPHYRKFYEAEFGVNPYKSLDRGEDFGEYLK